MKGWIVTKTENGESRTVAIINMTADCWGDEIYDKMIEMGWIETLDEYDVDGDNAHVAIMPKVQGLHEFSLDFYANINRVTAVCDGVPGWLMTEVEEGFALDSKDLVDFEPCFDHESYDSSYPAILGGIHFMPDADESFLFGLYLETAEEEEE